MLSAWGDLTPIAVTCACILSSVRSSMGRPFTFIANGMLSYHVTDFTEDRFIMNRLAGELGFEPRLAATITAVLLRRFPCTNFVWRELQGSNLRPLA